MTSGKRLLQKITPYARLVRGIDSPYRVAIIHILAYGAPTYPEDLLRHIPISQNLLAHHLKAMVSAGWLRKHRVGNHVLYAIERKAIREFAKFLMDTPFWRETKKPV